VPARQQTLRNTIAWSYHLLDAQEQHLFRQASVFVDGCTLKAIEAICAALDDCEGATPVLDAVSSLIDKSLLQQTEQERDEPRLVMLETLREYGLQALAASGELDPARHAHATYYLRLAEQVAPILRGPEQTVLLEQLEQDHQNLRAALQWWLEQGERGTTREPALRLCGALRHFWIVRGHYHEGRGFLEQALAGSEGVAALVRAQALAAAANLACEQSDDARLEVLAQESLALYRQLGAIEGIADALWMLGTVAWRKRGDFRAARALYEESVKLFKEAGHQQGTAWVLWMLANAVSNQGEYARGQALYEESLALFRALGNKRGMAWSLSHSALWILICQGDKQTVHARLEASQALSKELGDQVGIATCLWFSGLDELCQGASATAQALLEESVKLFRELGDRWCLACALTSLGKVAVSQGDLAAARAHFEESLEVARAEEDQYNTAFGLESLAEVTAAQGHLAWAARLWGAAETLREVMGIPALPVQKPVEQAAYEHAVASTRMQLGERPSPPHGAKDEA
jgi:tetratricopeptide (TPR) repeat protein